MLQGFWMSFISYLPVWNLDILTTIICCTVLWALYYVMIAGLKEIYDSLIVLGCVILLGGYMYVTKTPYNDSALLSGTLAALGIFISFFLQIVLSGGRWMGAWDLRIALLMGLLVGVSFAFPAWMLTYVAGSIIGISIILFSKIRHGLKASFQHQVPFWPFLAVGYLSILFFYPQISKFIEWYF